MAEFSSTSFSHNSCLLNQLPSNETKPNATLPFLKDLYFISGIFVAILSFVAATANGLLLLAIWKDPHKRFRTPSTVFVLGLTLADFLTGIVVGPIISHTRITFTPSSAFQKVGQISSMVSMNTSFIILLFLTWNQFAAIRFPHKHRHFVTTKKVKTCVFSAWFYSLLFTSLLLWVKEDIVYQIDFYAHNCTFMIFLTIAYVCLCGAFRKQTSKIVASTSLSTSNQLQAEQSQSNSSRRRRNSEKQFTIVAMILVLFIIACTLPATIVHMLYSNTKDNLSSMKSSEKGSLVALEVSSVILFLKFALDPFLYCWRLSSYRRALATILSFGNTRFVLEDVSASRSVRSRSVRRDKICDSKACESNTAL